MVDDGWFNCVGDAAGMPEWVATQRFIEQVSELLAFMKVRTDS